MNLVEKLGKMGIPGFRSGKKWKIIVAIFGYFIMGLLILTFNPMAVTIVIISISIIFWYTNFRDIQTNDHIRKIIGFRSDNKYKTAFAIFIYSILLFFIAAAIMLPPSDHKNTINNISTPASVISTPTPITITQVPTSTITPTAIPLTPSKYKGELRYYIGMEISRSMEIVGKDMIDYGDGIISLEELKQTIRTEKNIANLTLKNIQSLNVPMGYEITQKRALVIVETYVIALNNVENYLATSENKYLTSYQDYSNKMVRQTEELNKEIA